MGQWGMSPSTAFWWWEMGAAVACNVEEAEGGLIQGKMSPPLFPPKAGDFFGHLICLPTAKNIPHHQRTSSSVVTN